MSLVSTEHSALLKRLTQINRTISGSLDFDEILTLIAKNARDLVERQACLVLLADEDEVLTVRACEGVDRALCDGFAGAVDESVIAKLSDVLGLSPEHAISSVPILVNHTLRGVLVVVGDTPLDSDAVWLLSALADQAAIALRNARMHEAVIAHERRMSEAVRDLEAFTYSVAHDLRAPARSIAGFSALLQEEIAVRADPTVQEYLRRILSGVIRMDGLIRDLLAWSHLARVDVSVEPVDLGSVVAAARQQLEADMLERGARIDVVSPLPVVSAHRSMLVQAVANLLSNAIKFVARGTEAHVTVRAEQREGLVRLWVEDNGIGIGPAYHDRIFGAFERLNRMEDYTGTGIGLAIVRRGIERMGGRCGVESVPGEGSRFWIELGAG
jgi:signal transduction histidine kinase